MALRHNSESERRWIVKLAHRNSTRKAFKSQINSKANPKSTARLWNFHDNSHCLIYLWTQSKRQYIPSSHYIEKILLSCVWAKVLLSFHIHITFPLVTRAGKTQTFSFFVGNYIYYVFFPSSHIHHINISSFLIYTLIFHIQTNTIFCVTKETFFVLTFMDHSLFPVEIHTASLGIEITKQFYKTTVLSVNKW